ncbi:phospholipase D-like domain-containing protein [Roseicyclus mahoneyensis]|uniref:phospholipase D n=1 Tax=Roseicyclus mahoneyensis TaxID=164332 RepID=A0A316GRD9_9RHOB|nr:phospholipase D-like domain-containing protein [Roseicyclus mahoneyensis]PWK62582.1 phospholipase D-like protein [Roseicyclus mahoneyensis]
MTRAVFTSLQGGDALAASVIGMIERAGDAAAAGARVELQAMCFAFTDRRIAQALVDLCHAHPQLTLRIIADWSQSARGAPTVLESMADEGLRNLFIKFKLDVPYYADEDGRLRYSYGASRGMLHHKTLLLVIDGQPQAMTLGSYNWTARGRQAYENLVLTEDDAILCPFAEEFSALWADHRLTAATERTRHIMARLKSEAAQGHDLHTPERLADILGVGMAGDRSVPGPRRLADAAVMVAFSGRSPAAKTATAGHAPRNDRRAIELLRPSGARKPAPLTLNTLGLEAIRGVPGGASLRVAMYALSARVPEFAALIEAAQRDVRVELLLDGTIGARTAEGLRDLAARQGLPMTVATTRRRMHQKYLCCLETGLVLSGTANMTEDATTRHSDHRILWRKNPALAQAFAADFDTISGRVARGGRKVA